RERLEMLGHAVALVMLEAVAGIEQAQSRHEPVARDFGDDGGGGDRGHDGISADHSLAVAAAIDAVAAVDEHELRLDPKASDGARERPQRRPQDVVAVDAPRRRKGNRDLRARTNLGVQLFARLGIELFGIIESARHALGVEHDRGSHDWAGERAPPRFVATGHRPDAALDRGALAAEGRTDVLLTERQAHDADGCGAAGDGAGGYRATHGAMVRAAASKSTVPGLPAVKGGERRRLEQVQLLGGAL